ncbi:hypothetical protein PIB30_082464 [Stylosanthes scabra]|uniref:Uncharacterized protein n=1 Tax=Stylosanthes scabra TaxID=79078 RepID=A0ABU6QS30_9FABA|nr:hypothetical protein [Stylosanthes scabra]
MYGWRTGFVAVVEVSSIGFADYHATLEAVCNTVGCWVEIAGFHRSFGMLQWYGLLTIGGTHLYSKLYQPKTARMVDSEGVTSKTPFAAEVALTLKCWLLLAIDSINSQAFSGVLFIKAPPAEASTMALSVEVNPSKK